MGAPKGFTNSTVARGQMPPPGSAFDDPEWSRASELVTTQPFETGLDNSRRMR